MSLPGPDHRFYEGSYAPYQTDMWTDITPWIYAVIIVTVLVLVLGMAI